MQIIVQKFGGTSVQSKDSRKYVIQHIQEALSNHYKLVVVVSALGRQPAPYATDSLLQLVDYPNHYSSNREIDLLMSCGETISSVVLSNELKERNISTIALTGAQSGIMTSNDYNNAKINEVNPNRIYQELKIHDVVVVAGFQGQTIDGEITTIGRGGSDTTAAALGVALNAKQIEIFSDVNGIMTADPRIVKEAIPLQSITYEEICHLAYQGAKVIHPRAVEIAMHANIPVKICSTYEKSGGTVIRKEKDVSLNERVVTGIAYQSALTQIKVTTREEAYRLQSEVFKVMADSGISIDFINISSTEVTYTIPKPYTKKASQQLRRLGFHPEITNNCAKVSVVGSGMTGKPGVASTIVQALTDQGIQILQSADSYTTIWVLIRQKDLEKAVNSLHEAFDLSKLKSIMHDFILER